MNQKFNLSLIESILQIHGMTEDKYKIKFFLDSQIEKMPDFMRAGIFLIACIFNILTIFLRFRVFSSLGLKDRAYAISFFKPLPLFKIFFRFYESIILLKALELKC